MEKKGKKLSYQKLQELVPLEIRKKWEEEQNTLKTKLILEDSFDWTLDIKDPKDKKPLKYVRGITNEI